MERAVTFALHIVDQLSSVVSLRPGRQLGEHARGERLRRENRPQRAKPDKHRLDVILVGEEVGEEGRQVQGSLERKRTSPREAGRVL